MKYFHRLLRWLRITDEDHVVSLTHAFLVLACIVYWRHPDAVTAATAAAAVANYSAKNVLRRRDKAAQAAAESAKGDSDIVNTVKALAADVQHLKSAANWTAVLKR